MPSYTILLTKKAQKQLDKLTNNIAEPIIEAISNLENEPRPNGSIKLKGRESYRIRVGNYRVIYEIQSEELIIDVIALGHRRLDIEKMCISETQDHEKASPIRAAAWEKLR